MKLAFCAALAALAFAASPAAFAQTQVVPTAKLPNGNVVVSTPSAFEVAPAGGGPGAGRLVAEDNGLPVVSSAKPVTSTPAAVTITTALTFQSVLASNATRRGCTIQNTSADVEYVFFGANGSAAVATSVQLQPGQTVGCTVSSIVLTDNISMTSATLAGATAVVVSQ